MERGEEGKRILEICLFIPLLQSFREWWSNFGKQHSKSWGRYNPHIFTFMYQRMQLFGASSNSLEFTLFNSLVSTSFSKTMVFFLLELTLLSFGTSLPTLYHSGWFFKLAMVSLGRPPFWSWIHVSRNSTNLGLKLFYQNQMRGHLLIQREEIKLHFLKNLICSFHLI